MMEADAPASIPGSGSPPIPESGSPPSPRCRLAVITHYFSTHGGGVERVALEIAKRLSAGHGIEVAWCASDCDSLPDEAGIAYRPMRAWNGLERFGLPWPVWSIRSVRKLADAIRKADVVHLHDFIYFGSLAAFLLSRAHGKPVILTQHIGNIPYENRFLRTLLRLINRVIGSLVLSRAEQVVFYSRVVQAEFAGVSFRAAPISIANGIDPVEFHPVSPELRREIRLELGNGERDGPVFLFVGRFVEKKGMPLLRRLARELPNVNWWILGWGATSSEFDPATWRLPNVKLFFDRSGEILSKLYRGADLLVLPSKGEGFPLAVQQAMACGTPALVSSATADAVPDTRPFLVVCDLTGGDDDFTNARAALSGMLEGDRLARMREDVASHASHEWSWERTAGCYGLRITELARR